MFTFVSFVGFFLVYAIYSPTQIMYTSTLLVCSTFGIVAAYLVSRVVLARVCDEKAPTFCAITLPVPLFALYSLIHLVVPNTLPLLNEEFAIWVYLAFALVLYTHFAYDIMSSISQHLGIYCFSLGKRTNKDEITTLLEEVITTDEKQH
jgi:hypothetical protein